VRLFEHRLEDRGEVAGRGIDDLQHLGNGSLLLQGFARLGQEPRILHCDDRLRREIFSQSDLFIAERPYFLPKENDDGRETSIANAQRWGIIRPTYHAT
jgi:hypothetical protein